MLCPAPPSLSASTRTWHRQSLKRGKGKDHSQTSALRSNQIAATSKKGRITCSLIEPDKSDEHLAIQVGATQFALLPEKWSISRNPVNLGVRLRRGLERIEIGSRSPRIDHRAGKQVAGAPPKSSTPSLILGALKTWLFLAAEALSGYPERRVDRACIQSECPAADGPEIAQFASPHSVVVPYGHSGGGDRAIEFGDESRRWPTGPGRPGGARRRRLPEPRR